VAGARKQIKFGEISEQKKKEQE
jgi:hypothetical protein